MFDPAIIDTLTMPLPPEPPRVVEERSWLSDSGRQAQRVANQIAVQYGAIVEDWLARISRLKASYELLTMGAASSAELQLIDDEIERVERLASSRARWRMSFAKSSKKTVGRLFNADPSLGAVSRTLANKLIQLDDQVIGSLVEYGLFLRAARAERDSAHVPGSSFTSSDELSRHLNAIIAADA